MRRELSGYPCVDRISFLVGEKWREEIWEGVLSERRRAPVETFQMWIVASEVPPPEASRWVCQGHHASAFTAAVWLRLESFGVCGVSVREEEESRESQMLTRLSLAPEAR